MNELITIGIPLYNMQNSIKTAIDSCLSQTYQNFEIVVVDDGSVDNGIKIVEAYKDKRIKIYKKETNSGVCDTMNKIVDVAKGEYIAFLDADDEMMSTRIEKQYNAIKKAQRKHPTRMVASFCGSKMIDLSTNKISYLNPNNLFSGSGGFGGGTGHSMYRLADIKALGKFDTRFSRSADSALCINFLVHDGYYAMIDEPLITYNFVWNKEKEKYSQEEAIVFRRLVNEIFRPEDYTKKYLKNFDFEWKKIRNLMKYNAQTGNSAYLKNFLDLLQRKKISWLNALYLLIYCSIFYIFRYKKEIKLCPHTYFISSLIQSCNYNSYLELGTFNGNNFKHIIYNNNLFAYNCVDLTRQHTLSDDYFYEMTTDEFFAQNNKKFDLIFIDANHDYIQVVKDFENSLRILNEGGTIVIHDSDPETPELLKTEYCSDSYKINDYLNNKPELMYLNLPISNCGLTLVRRKQDTRCLKFLSKNN